MIGVRFISQGGHVVSEAIKPENLPVMLKRLFVGEDFLKRHKHKKILAPMPDYKQYLEDKAFVLSQASTAAPFLKPCYSEPILSREQEFHVLRAFNYCKYRAARAIAKCPPDKLAKSAAAQQAIKWMRQAYAFRDVAVLANMRLGVKFIKKYIYRHYFNDVVSECYFQVLQAVDYFDWRKGFKLGTYALSCIYRGICKVVSDNIKHGERFKPKPDDLDVPEIVKHSPWDLNEFEIAGVINRLLITIDPLDATAIRYNVLEDLTLVASGKRMGGITKERVRQRKLRGIFNIQKRVALNGLPYED